ncbi:tetratricopeptide repeat protein [Wenzhouxiangella sp. EGI_FJ10305]|uniref:tetratricopeptide repeat protein n=1 Tax=Wenzhouxiangella sp. EGI_FJ10305 TaxID=3243768 RepID=UPI0035DB8EA3
MSKRTGRLTPLRRRVLDAEFERLLELDESQRSERLHRLAERCPRLTRWLGPLLEALSDKADHLEAMIREVADSAVTELDGDDAELPKGTRLGAWELTQLVGRGGMGHVYRAERADGAFEMEAAVKVIRMRRDRRLRTRLTLERQLLARLDHANIARILDGGTTDDGQAWLVMEWVGGRDLHRCRDDHVGDCLACLGHFLPLAEAVSHAHQRRVVHGDIKPANVRVGDDGRVRLLDFGVARLLAGEADDPHNRIRALTPAWSAPELRAGEPVSTQSDLWSLGALLFWMLTGDRLDPELADDARLLAMRLGRHCPRRDDLAAIIATAGASRPEDRYASVTDLIRDIERYRRCEPVQVRTPSRRYVTTRFVQRNPFAVGLSTLAAVLLVLGLAGTSWQAQQAAVERDRARLEAGKTERVSEFLIGLFEQADPWRARQRELSARDLVDRGAERIRVLNESPQVQAEMYRILARVHRGLADYEQAGRLALEAVEMLESEPGATALVRAEAWALRANTLASQGRYREAESAHRRALAMVADEAPPVRAGFINGLGLTLYSLGRLDEARELLERALAIRLEHQPGSAELAESHNNLALLHATADRNELARDHYERAIELRRSVLGEDHPTTSFSLTNLASLLVQTGRAEEALPAFREALAIRRNAFNADHPAVGSVLYQMGWAYANLEQYDEAEKYYEQALAIREASMGNDHPSVAVLYNAMSSVARAQGNHAEALELLEKALRIYRSRYGESHHDIALVLGNLGATHMVLGDFERAVGLLQRALEMNRAELGERHHHVADNLRTLAELHFQSRDFEQASEYARQALGTYQQLHDEAPHPALADTRQLLEKIDAGR